MEIPLQAQIECTDGICGLSVYVLINPLVDEVTSLVVRETSSNMEYIVPVDVIATTIVDTIRLNCSKAELEKMKPFVKTDFVEEKMPIGNIGHAGGMYGMGSFYYLPFVTPEITVQVPVEHLQIPPATGRITYLVMREGHLWGAKNVIIPLSAMDDSGDDTLFLNLDKQQIESLPTFPVHRLWT